MTTPASAAPGLLRPGFLVPLIAVLVIGIGLPFGLQRLTAAARKQSIDIRVPLRQLEDAAMPSFRLRRDIEMDTVGPEWLGTAEMLIVPVEPLEAGSPFSGGTVGQLPTLFISYYSDPDETIPHTPEVCYDQAGASIRGVTRVPISLPGRTDGPHEAKRIIADQTGLSTRVVLYVLYHNGVVLSDRQQVRRAMAMPGDDYTYFAKIEAVVPVLSTMTEDEAEALARSILEEAIPVVAEQHLPRDAALRSTGAPAETPAAN